MHRDERCEFQKVVIYEKVLFYELQPIIPYTILTPFLRTTTYYTMYNFDLDLDLFTPEWYYVL